MALKGPRVEFETDITLACDVVAEAGVTLVMNTSGSGVAVGDSAGTTTLISTTPSGYIVHGVLLNDVVSYDTTRYHGNFHKDEMRVNQPSRVLRKGQVTTNKVTGAPTQGATAYLVASGLVSPTVHATGGIAATPKVGNFASIKDENGYAKLDVNLPIV